MGFGDVYNTTVNVNGNTVFRSRFSTCCCGPMFPPPMMSCFGFGYGGFGFGGFGCYGSRAFEAGLGAGVGFAAGTALIPALPSIFKGIGSGLSWIGKKVIAPAATFTWNKVLKPVGKAIWSGIKSVGKGIGSLFHKKNKTKTEGTKEDK